MPAVTRKDDNCTGHGCFPPRANNGGSGNVKTNSKPTHRKGDGWTPHGCPNVPPHGSSTAAGSATVYANGKAVARIGDPVACGSAIAQGSGNVFAGDSGESFTPPEFTFPEFTPFPAPKLRDAPALYPSNIQTVDDSANANPINNSEQIESINGEKPEYEELSSGMCGEMPQRNPYEVAQKALSMGNSAWKETGNNPNITALWDEIGYQGNQYADETAWCAVFVGATLKRSGNKYHKTAMARGYESYGKEIPWNEMQPGDIVVMFRNGRSSGSGHVGFATGNYTNNTVDMIGGNQGNTLSVRTYKRNSGSRGVLTIRRAVSCEDGKTLAPQVGQVNAPKSSGVGGQVT